MSHFLAVIIFSEYLIFRNETSTEQPLCENRKFFREVTFGNSYFFGEVIAQNKHICRRAPSIEAGTSVQHQLFQKGYIFKKLFFQKRNIPHYLLFLESYLFREATFSKDITFYSSNLFRRASFSQHTFSDGLLFHNYASSTQLHLLFISQ